MKIKINKEKCLGCGMCIGIDSEVFNFDDDGLAKADSEKISDNNKEQVIDAVNSCPVGAIEEE